MCDSYTTSDIAAETGHTQQQVNNVCRELFGSGGWRRELTPEQRERILRAFQQPGRKKRFSQIATTAIR